MKKLTVLIIFLLLCGVTGKLNAQAGFFLKSQLGISYNDIKPWRAPSNVKTSHNQKSLNEIQSFGLKLDYDINTKLFMTIRYELDKVDHSDFNRDFFNSAYFISVGYKHTINRINEIRPKIGFAVTNIVDYTTIITQVQGQPETRNVRHYYYGKEPFRNWSIGLFGIG